MDDSGDPNIKGDVLNILLLIFMYVLQFIPRGLSLAIPFILQNRESSYVDQAEFSFVWYSYCFKLLWAPLVDCVYSRKIGRRKTWLVPTQYSIGALLLLISMNIDDWLGSEDGSQKPKIHFLTITFFACSFIASTQDIAVDGWSLTMLQKRNVGYAGTCNLIGYVIGQFLGYVLFIILDSKEFCNRFRSVPLDHGLVKFGDFILFWSVVFFISTTLILVFHKETDTDINVNKNCEYGPKKSYLKLWQILKMNPIRTICFIFITCEMGFGPINGVVRLKLTDAGVPQENFALLTIPSLLLILILTFVVSRYLTGNQSLRTFVASYIFKLLLGIVYAVLIFYTPYIKNGNKTLPSWYYWILIFVYNFENLVDHVTLITVGAFFCRVSDPGFGGIYLTLFNTMSNIGHGWPISLSLWLVDPLTIQYRNEGKKLIDGFYVEIIICTLIGIWWLRWGLKEILKLENMDAFSCIEKENENREEAITEE